VFACTTAIEPTSTSRPTGRRAAPVPDHRRLEGHGVDPRATDTRAGRRRGLHRGTARAARAPAASPVGVNASGRPSTATGGSPTRSGWPGQRSSRAGSQPGTGGRGPIRRWQRSCGRQSAPRTSPGAGTTTNRVGCAATRSASSSASVTHRMWTRCGQRAVSNGEDEQAGTATLRRSDRVWKLHDHQRVAPASTASPASHSLDAPRLTPTPAP
jgi:hypothetical protein